MSKNAVTPADLGEFFWTSTDLMSILGNDGSWLIVNSAWPTSMGWSLEDLQSGPFFDLIHPDDVASTATEFDRLLAAPDATLVNFVNRQRHRDGSYHSIEWSCQGRGGLVFSAGRDITERVTNAERLTESLGLTRAILDAAPDSIIVIDENFFVVDVSRGTEQIFGTPAQDRYWRSATDVVLADDRPEVEALLTRLFAGSGDERSTYRFRARHADGHQLTIETSARLLPEVEGRGRHAVLVSRDVSETVAALDALEAAKSSAEGQSLAKTEFLSRMSHELRTPLTAVLGFAQIMTMEAHSPDQGEMLDYIRVSGDQLLALMNDVLDVSRVEDGSINIVLEPVSLNEIVRECVTLFLTQAKASSIEIAFQIDSSFVVVADRQRLIQVVVNLVSNAVKYNREGGTISIGAERVGDIARLTVTDTGIGVARENLSRLFAPFERLDARVSKVEGTGLGLSLSKGLVEAMGGKLDVESIADEGSTFWIDLPAADARAIPAITAPLDDTASVNVKATVLYIDDTRANLRLVGHYLGNRPGVRVLTATLGQQGLELAREQVPDLILLDAWLPDLHGFHVLRQLRDDPATSRIPVVVVSGDATTIQQRRFEDAGAEEFMAKPLDLERLLKVVDTYLKPISLKTTE